MQNVKDLLQSWKHDLAHADSLTGTDHETLNSREFESLSFQIEQLEEAIKKDDQSRRYMEQEESEFNDSLNIQRYTL